MKPKITVLTLGVEDLETSYKFYHEGLGWPSQGIIGKEFEHGAVAFFDLQVGLKLALWPRKSLAIDSGLPLDKPSATELSLGHNVDSKAEVDSLMALVERAGYVLGWLFGLFPRSRWASLGSGLESTNAVSFRLMWFGIKAKLKLFLTLL
ncbi:MAG: hypothetical protein NVS3B3_02800 [Aquirhabdus sp.]